MKRQYHLPFLFFIVITAFCFSHCKKENNPLNITLYNKPVSTIKSYINGKWKIVYDLGGITGNIRHDYVNSFVEFKFLVIDSINETHNGSTIIRSQIQWFKDRDLFTGDSINLLGFNYYQTGLPFAYRISQITNDTLVVTQPAPDSYSLMLIRP